MGYNYSNFTLRVDPADLQNTAGSLEKKIQNLKRLYDEMLSKVNSTAHYWQGDASEKYRRDFKAERPDFEEAFARISEHVSDLYSIAGIYTGVEKTNTEIASELSADVIV